MTSRDLRFSKDEPPGQKDRAERFLVKLGRKSYYHLKVCERSTPGMSIPVRNLESFKKRYI